MASLLCSLKANWDPFERPRTNYVQKVILIGFTCDISGFLESGDGGHENRELGAKLSVQWLVIYPCNLHLGFVTSCPSKTHLYIWNFR